MEFLQVGKSNRSYASFLSKASISSAMAFFQSIISYDFIVSRTVMGSSSIIDKQKLAQKLGGIYLFGFLLSLTNLLNIGV
jgi:hypothetical protein